MLRRNWSCSGNYEVENTHLHFFGDHWPDCTRKFWSHDQDNLYKGQNKMETEEVAEEIEASNKEKAIRQFDI